MQRVHNIPSRHGQTTLVQIVTDDAFQSTGVMPSNIMCWQQLPVEYYVLARSTKELIHSVVTRIFVANSLISGRTIPNLRILAISL